MIQEPRIDIQLLENGAVRLECKVGSGVVLKLERVYRDGIIELSELFFDVDQPTERRGVVRGD